MPGQEGLKLEEKVLASSPGTGAMACRTLPPHHWVSEPHWQVGTEPGSRVGTCQTSSFRPWLGSQAQAVLYMVGQGKDAGGGVMLWGVSITIYSMRKYTMGLDSAARLPGPKSSFVPYVTLDLSLSLSEPLFSHLYNEMMTLTPASQSCCESIR